MMFSVLLKRPKVLRVIFKSFIGKRFLRNLVYIVAFITFFVMFYLNFNIDYIMCIHEL